MEIRSLNLEILSNFTNKLNFFENQIIINCCLLLIYCPLQSLGLELIWSSNFFHKTINVHFIQHFILVLKFMSSSLGLFFNRFLLFYLKNK